MGTEHRQTKRVAEAAVLQLFLFTMVSFGQAGSQASKAAGSERPFPMTSSRALLLTIQDNPEIATEQAITTWALAQIRVEQQLWPRAAPAPGGARGMVMPLITYEWQKYIDTDPELAEGPLLDTFLRQDADWSFAKKDARWVESMSTKVQVFLFSHDAVEGRSPEFAARAMAPVLKRFLDVAVKRTPRHLYFTTPLPRFQYDFDAGGIRFITPGTMQRDGKYSFSEKVDLLYPVADIEQQFEPPPPNSRTSGWIAQPASARSRANYRVFNPNVAMEFKDDLPSSQPGGSNYSPTAAWRTAFPLGTGQVLPNVNYFSFDRTLAISSIPVDVARAESLVKMDAVTGGGAGGLKARVFFHVGRVDLGKGSGQASGGMVEYKFGTMLATLEKVEILGLKDEIVATLRPDGFPKPKPR